MSKLYLRSVQIQVSNALNSSQSGHWATLYPQSSAIRREIKSCNKHRTKYPHKLEEWSFEISMHRLPLLNKTYLR